MWPRSKVCASQLVEPDSRYAMGLQLLDFGCKCSASNLHVWLHYLVFFGRPCFAS
jgi:hypothetical protein